MRILLLLFLLVPGLKAQTALPGSWAMFFGNIPLKSKSWELFTDVQLRDKSIFQQHDQVMLRAGITHKFNPHFSGTIGFANILFYASDADLHEPRTIENRYWSQFLYVNDFRKGRWDVRYRFEYRDLDNVVPFRSRLRLHAWQPLPLVINHKNRFRAHIYNEIFINTQANNWHYDRNRLYGSIGYKMAPLWELQIGYLNQDVRHLGSKSYFQIGMFYN